MGQDRRFTPRETSSGKICAQGRCSVTVNGLPFGVYSLEEKQAPEGMAKSQERYRVELKAPGQTEEVSYHTVTVKNTRTKARIKIYKADSETKNPLAGARFGLYTAGEIKNASGQVLPGEYADCFGAYRTGRFLSV